jgi:hypothetical protein
MSTMRFERLKMLKKSLFTAAVLLLSTAAHANSINLSYLSPNTKVTTKVSVNNNTLYTYMGSYNLLASNSSKPLVGFCVDPFQWANSTPSHYQVSALDASDFFSGNGATRFNNVQKLFDNAYANLSGSQQTAGFHLALWEIFHDDLNTTSGIISSVSASDAGMIAAANTFLGALNGWSTTNAYNLTFYGSGHYQDFLTASPSSVPVPAALPLLASGMLGYGFLRRRKKII